MRFLTGLSSRVLAVAVLILAVAPVADARPPHDPYGERSPNPIISYRLRVDTADLTGFAVERRIRSGGDTLRLAMAAHPEYDDRYWRYLLDLHVTGSDGSALAVIREDSVLWRIVARDGDALVRYRIVLPVPAESPRAAWRPYLTPTGGLVGGPHAFMYLTSAPRTPSRVTIDLPAGWDVATGLARRAAPHVFEASDAATLMDSPMLVGRFGSWRFAIDGVRTALPTGRSQAHLRSTRSRSPAASNESRGRRRRCSAARRIATTPSSTRMTPTVVSSIATR